MQVSCSHCGARYEFDADAIPAAGYDAQCTTCNGVFFVAPQQEVPAAQVAVSCNNCGAVYQFSASEIPPAGYDAQCTQCQAVFFVGPATIAPATPVALPDSPAHSTSTTEIFNPAATQTVEDIPTMDAADFASESEVMKNPLLAHEQQQPPAGFEEGVTRPFQVPNADVSEPLPPLGDMPLPVPVPVVPVVPMSVPSTTEHEQTTQRGFSPQALHSGTMEIDLAEVEPEPAEPELAEDDAEPAPAPRRGGRATKTDEFSDVMAINAELGEPIGDSGGHLTPEEEVEGIHDRRSQRWLGIVGGVLGVGVLCGLLYLVAPRAFDMTLGRVVGIKRTVDPAAVPFVDKGVAAMLEDTDEAYAKAAKEFDQAVKIDPLYADALALGAVAQVWRGSDLQIQGAELVQMAQREQANVRGIQEVTQRPPALTSKLVELQKLAQQHREAGTDLLETGGHYISDGLGWLLRARRHFPKSILLAEAEAICYGADPDGLPRADKALARSFELRYGPKAAPPAGGPPDAWVPFAQGTIRATDKGATEQVEELWLSALKEEPKFQRTRWLLARLYARTGQREAAKHVLDDILTAIPTHTKAKALLASLVAPAAAPVAAPPEELAHGAHAAKGKAKSKHH